MKKIIFIVLITGVFITQSLAQNTFSIQYSMGFGGTIDSYISSTSLRGVTVEYKWYLQPNLSIGIDAGWNNFYERRAFDTYTSGTLSLSGVQFRYANAVPIFVTTSYFFAPGEKINPFFGIGVGTIFMSRYLDMGAWRVTEDAWHFGLKPEVGIVSSLAPDLDLVLAFRFNNAFATSDAIEQNYMTFNVGFVWK